VRKCDFWKSELFAKDALTEEGKKSEKRGKGAKSESKVREGIESESKVKGERKESKKRQK
jgi:hypothetical protein